MRWEYKFTDRAFKGFQKLDPQIARRIIAFIEERVLEHPTALGEPLAGNWAGFWRYRVDDCRIICEHRKDALLLVVVAVAHRREVYK